MNKKELAKAVIADSRNAMAVIFRNVPPSYNWGFFSNEDSRMHLQAVDSQNVRLGYKIWLEENGNRIFQQDVKSKQLPPKVFKYFQEFVNIQENTNQVELKWLRLMMKKGWIKFKINGTAISIYCYSGMPHQFIRVLDVAQELPGAIDDFLKTQKVRLCEEMGSLQIYGLHPWNVGFDDADDFRLWGNGFLWKN